MSTRIKHERPTRKVNTRPTLTLEDCRSMSAAAEKEAVKNNWAVSIAILDDGGHLLHVVRMDGSTPAHVEVAVLKARTAALTRRPSKIWEDRVASGRMVLLKLPMLPVQGGLPIIAEGTCVGSIGVSGVQSHEDEQIGRVGIGALGLCAE
jgi:glc operon protein GlcG